MDTYFVGTVYTHFETQVHVILLSLISLLSNFCEDATLTEFRQKGLLEY